jgi:hypothetical protein
VTALGMNGAYLSALKAHLPLGQLEHSTGLAHDRRRTGVHLITPPHWDLDAVLPNPIGNRDSAPVPVAPRRGRQQTPKAAPSSTTPSGAKVGDTVVPQDAKVAAVTCRMDPLLQTNGERTARWNLAP